ncbi:uncharacterized protein LACBIDRAFT_335187 [Laccaria bicolor S238N-H82]|uniref:Predicted protein n=1 Tax=Laccaria bicolor (strain S238N-H82 / ATCC MYA-4686) TaxID=486041 RepID=B0E1M3_LACBS|nr:uncharacterized protein LACBIDRAFT_335187 [Laccaria bicolor S238N-H82]EDQ99263.1 predicted protein [Laccaria bicolor S238N-H82]|eukprot:XP_001890073.1 predicted protein [Laccaria bicolor S238N-H82]
MCASLWNLLNVKGLNLRYLWKLLDINNQLTAGFNQMNQQLAVALAISRNTRVLAHNRLHDVPRAYRPLYKTIPGNGLNLANHIYANFANVQDILIAPAEEPAVGTVPPNFSTNFSAYTTADFVRLIIFYNEDFGIVVGDTIESSINKLCGFLTY